MLGIKGYLQTLQDIYESKECIVVGLGLELPKILAELNFDKIYVAEADTRQIDRLSEAYTSIKSIKIVEDLVFKDEDKVDFYVASNPSASSFKGIEEFKEVFPNVKLEHRLLGKSTSLESFVAKHNIKKERWLVLNTLNAKAILEENIIDGFDVVLCKTINSEENSLKKWASLENFKRLRVFEKNNPKIFWSVFIKRAEDVAKQKEQKLKKRLEISKEKEVELSKKLEAFKSLENEFYLYLLSRNYYIKPDYTSRTEYTHFNDLENEDEWQLEVYLHALGLMKKHKLRKIVDIGCGSGYKLMHYFDGYDTIGLEVNQNLEFLKEKYPEHTWLESNFKINHNLDADVVICSDVIEHLVDPNELFSYIENISFKYLVLSTPDRELVYEEGSDYLNGPPRNPAHVREWNFDEFEEYVSQYFQVIDHRVTNLGQSTQLIICEKMGK